MPQAGTTGARAAAIGTAAAVLLTLAAPAGAANAKKPSGMKPDAAAQAADPARLIDPDMYATAIEVQQTKHFKSITITPLDKSENSKALIRTVLADQSGMEDLRKAVRGNRALMKALEDRGLTAGDVVSVTTDRNDNAIVFVKG